MGSRGGRARGGRRAARRDGDRQHARGADGRRPGARRPARRRCAPTRASSRVPLWCCRRAPLPTVHPRTPGPPGRTPATSATPGSRPTPPPMRRRPEHQRAGDDAPHAAGCCGDPVRPDRARLRRPVRQPLLAPAERPGDLRPGADHARARGVPHPARHLPGGVEEARPRQLDLRRRDALVRVLQRRCRLPRGQPRRDVARLRPPVARRRGDLLLHALGRRHRAGGPAEPLSAPGRARARAGSRAAARAARR